MVQTLNLDWRVQAENMVLLSSLTTSHPTILRAVKTTESSTAPPDVKLTEMLLTSPCLPLCEHKHQLLEHTILLNL